MSIEILKLVNGETLLTEVTHDDDRRFANSQIHIIDPVQMTIQTRQDSSSVCVCTIWVPLLKPTNLFSMDHSNILVRTVVDEDMEMYYNRCLETIYNAAETGGGSFFTSAREPSNNESMTASDMTELLKKLKIAADQPVANTALH